MANKTGNLLLPLFDWLRPPAKCLYLPGDGPGSVEHYWHFMIGFLLPLVELLTSAEAPMAGTNPSRSIALVRSCGPVMDRLTDEVLSTLSLRYTIVRPESIDTGWGKIARTVVARWDSEDSYLPKDHVHRAAQVVKDALADRPCCQEGPSLKHSVLLLKRSPEPSYYRQNGPAEIATYGTGRRSLIGLEESAEKLTALGLRTTVFEPGSHNLACQIRAFHGARGIVGVRGAEFTNLLWARPGIPVVMITPKSMARRLRHPQRSLSELMGLKFFNIPTENDHSVLDVDRVAQHLSSSLSGLHRHPSE